MLTLTGTVLGVLRLPERTYEGKTRPAYSQVQLMVEETLQDGQTRAGVQTLTTERPDAFEPHRSHPVSVEVRAYVSKGGVAYAMGPQTTPNAL